MLILQKLLNKEVYQYLLSKELPEFTAKLIATRINNIETLEKSLDFSIKNISSPFLFKDIDKAVDRLYQAIVNNEVIGLETDHDCDGQTSHAIFYEALTNIFGQDPKKIRSYIGHRMKEGYGLSESVMNRILTDDIRPSLIITADNGSTDEPRIKVLKQNGIDTIVTDHHAIPPEGVPKSAVAVLNPTQEGCEFPDKSIAGCYVAWLFMAALRRKFIEENREMSKTYSLTELLDFVAIGTVADCVSMANSFNNRIITKLGIEQLKKNNRKCWDVFERERFSSQYIGFTVAPILNSDGRVADALGSVNFLLSDCEEDIEEKFESLKIQNDERKQIQKQISEEALNKAKELNESKNSLCILLDDGHAGVHGISASRLKDAFGKPIIIFSQTQMDENLISGSARSVDEIHIKKVLDSINELEDDLIIKYGGHSGAAGLTIKKENYSKFYDLFEQEISRLVESSKIELGPRIYYDFELAEHEFGFETLDMIDSLEPFGREFEKPIFCNEFTIENLRFVGRDQSHAQLVLRMKNKSIKAIWFNATDNISTEEFSIGDKVRVCYELQKEEFLGNVNLSLNIKTMQNERL